MFQGSSFHQRILRVTIYRQRQRHAGWWLPHEVGQATPKIPGDGDDGFFWVAHTWWLVAPFQKHHPQELKVENHLPL